MTFSEFKRQWYETIFDVIKSLPTYLMTIILTWIMALKYYSYVDSKIPVLYSFQKTEMADGYRSLTGYDSVQVLYHEGKWEAHFCYPNQWEADKFKMGASGWIGTDESLLGNVIYLPNFGLDTCLDGEKAVQKWVDINKTLFERSRKYKRDNP